jgi:hypothetical protein
MPNKRSAHLRAFAILAGSVVACLILADWLPSHLPREPYPSASYCWRGDPFLLRLHDWSNLAIWVEYVSFPVLLGALFLRARGWRVARAFPLLALLVGSFIVACGGTHLFGRIELWQATPTLAGYMLALTATLGGAAIFELWRVYPQLEAWLVAMRLADEEIRRR